MKTLILPSVVSPAADAMFVALLLLTAGCSGTVPPTSVDSSETGKGIVLPPSELASEANSPTKPEKREISSAVQSVPVQELTREEAKKPSSQDVEQERISGLLQRKQEAQMELESAKEEYSLAMELSLLLEEEELNRRGKRQSVDQQIERAVTEKSRLDLLSEFRVLFTAEQRTEIQTAIVSKADIRGMVKTIIADIRDLGPEKTLVANKEKELLEIERALETPEERTRREEAERIALQESEKRRSEDLQAVRGELSTVSSQLTVAEESLSKAAERKRTLEELSAKRSNAKRPSFSLLAERAKTSRLQLRLLDEVGFLFDEGRLTQLRDDIEKGTDQREVIAKEIAEAADISSKQQSVEALRLQHAALTKKESDLMNQTPPKENVR